MLNEEWEAFYEIHLLSVYKFLLYFVGNREDAKDLAQETFIRAFSKWKQYKYQANIKTWLLAIAKNLATDYYRKQKRTSLLTSVVIEDEPIARDMPEQMLCFNEITQDLYRAITRLKPDYRAVVILRGVQEYTPDQTALILGWSTNRVNVSFHRAIKTLRQFLQNDDEGGGL